MIALSLCALAAAPACGGAEALDALRDAGIGHGGSGGGGFGIDAATGTIGGGGSGGTSGGGGGAGGLGGGGAGGGATDANVDVGGPDASGGTGGGQADAGRAVGGGGMGGAPVDAGPGGAGGQGGAPRPVVISIDFVGTGVAMAATETAGVVPATRWNSAAAASGTLSALIESDGTATAAGVTWDGGSVWVLPVADAPGNARMMNGYLDPFFAATVSVTGLPATLTATGYDVYVYANGDVTTGDARTGIYAIGTAMQTVTQVGPTPFTGTFVPAVGGGMGNYVVFRGVTGASFTLTATVSTGQTRRAPLNGLQIVTAGTGP